MSNSPFLHDEDFFKAKPDAPTPKQQNNAKAQADKKEEPAKVEKKEMTDKQRMGFYKSDEGGEALKYYKKKSNTKNIDRKLDKTYGSGWYHY